MNKRKDIHWIQASEIEDPGWAYLPSTEWLAQTLVSTWEYFEQEVQQQRPVKLIQMITFIVVVDPESYGKIYAKFLPL